MTSGKLILAALFLSSAGALTAIAPVQAAKDSVAEQLRTWDPDSDGTVDMAEASKAAGAKFDSLDGDHDGTLDMKEMKPTKVDEKTFRKADPDKDGTLSKDEYLTIVEMQFKSADPDHDGTLALAELETRAGQKLARLLK
jgi:Ca2+-binding EF-hand superfamily protein